MKTPHKHAAILRAIADGVPFDRIEINIHGNGWGPYESHSEMYLVGRYTESAEFRIKPEETVRYVNIYRDMGYASIHDANEGSFPNSRKAVMKITVRDDGTFEVEKV